MRQRIRMGEQRQTELGEGAHVPFLAAACAADDPAVESGKRTPSDILVIPVCLRLDDRVSTRTLGSRSAYCRLRSRFQTDVGNVARWHFCSYGVQNRTNAPIDIADFFFFFGRASTHRALAIWLPECFHSPTGHVVFQMHLEGDIGRECLSDCWHLLANIDR